MCCIRFGGFSGSREACLYILHLPPSPPSSSSFSLVLLTSPLSLLLLPLPSPFSSSLLPSLLLPPLLFLLPPLPLFCSSLLLPFYSLLFLSSLHLLSSLLLLLCLSSLLLLFIFLFFSSSSVPLSPISSSYFLFYCSPLFFNLLTSNVHMAQE